MYEALIADDVFPAADGGLAVRCDKVVYRLEAAHRDVDALTNASRPTTVSCWLEAADETLTLLGFSSVERRALYRALRDVDGIGRRSAMLVLDCGEVLDTLRAVAGEDTAYFRHVPGLGQKRIGAVIGELSKRYKQVLPHPLDVAVAHWVEARDALVAEGASINDAEARLRDAMQRAPKPPSSSQALLALL